MFKSCRGWVAAVAVSMIYGLAGDRAVANDAKSNDVASIVGSEPVSSGSPALTVALTTPQRVEWPQTIVANGNIAAWQEAVIGSEISGHPLTEVLVNTGDVVKKGQLLARVSSDMVSAELEQTKAAVVEAEAILAEARLNASRARKVESAGAMSAQQINQYLTAEQTVLARVNAAKAKLKTDELRLAQTHIVAPDDGVISSRTATVGSLVQPGLELFRLIRGNRLEWRAEVTAAELGRIDIGTKALVTLPDGTRIQGKVRIRAPTVDVQTRNAIVFVDLPNDSSARAGMFARGEFELGASAALTLPQSAVLIRDGFNYVFRIADNHRAVQIKVRVGRRVGDRIEITDGLDANTRVVVSGAGFLADGDIVRIVETVE